MILVSLFFQVKYAMFNIHFIDFLECLSKIKVSISLFNSLIKHFVFPELKRYSGTTFTCQLFKVQFYKNTKNYVAIILCFETFDQIKLSNRRLLLNIRVKNWVSNKRRSCSKIPNYKIWNIIILYLVSQKKNVSTKFTS